MISRATGLHALLLAALALAAVPACSSARFADALGQVDRAAVPHQAVTMTAERYEFTPEELHVKAGTLVTPRLVALDGEHGFALPDWDIDVELERDEAVTVEFFAPTPGTYEFKCSHFCGMGHFGMSGRIIVEP